MKSLYEILGVERDTSPTQIRKAYLQLSLKYHPDKNTDRNAAEKFSELRDAYNVLSNPDSRKEYDKYGYYEASAISITQQEMNKIVENHRKEMEKMLQEEKKILEQQRKERDVKSKPAPVSSVDASVLAEAQRRAEEIERMQNQARVAAAQEPAFVAAAYEPKHTPVHHATAFHEVPHNYAAPVQHNYPAHPPHNHFHTNYDQSGQYRRYMEGFQAGYDEAFQLAFNDGFMEIFCQRFGWQNHSTNHSASQSPFSHDNDFSSGFVEGTSKGRESGGREGRRISQLIHSASNSNPSPYTLFSDINELLRLTRNINQQLQPKPKGWFH